MNINHDKEQTELNSFAKFAIKCVEDVAFEARAYREAFEKLIDNLHYVGDQKWQIQEIDVHRILEELNKNRKENKND